jgi:metal iron transporter
MNCPSRTEEPEGDGFNQNPSALSGDLTTRQDLNGIANARMLRRIASSEVENVVERNPDDDVNPKKPKLTTIISLTRRTKPSHVGESIGTSPAPAILVASEGAGEGGGSNGGKRGFLMKWFNEAKKFFMTFGKFVGPGFMV